MSNCRRAQQRISSVAALCSTEFGSWSCWKTRHLSSHMCAPMIRMRCSLAFSRLKQRPVFTPAAQCSCSPTLRAFTVITFVSRHCCVGAPQRRWFPAGAARDCTTRVKRLHPCTSCGDAVSSRPAVCSAGLSHALISFARAARRTASAEVVMPIHAGSASAHQRCKTCRVLRCRFRCSSSRVSKYVHGACLQNGCAGPWESVKTLCS